MLPSINRNILLPLLLGLSGSVIAQTPSTSVATDPVIDDALVAGGFLDAHPDLKFRQTGLQAYTDRAFGQAMAELKRAAWYGDKPSQAVVAEMYWGGVGVPVDRVLGMVWMDLAAERGYRFFSQKRDYYWNQLDDQERKAAIRLARSVFADYGDDATMPRIAAVLRRERAKMTGSRVGSMSRAVQVFIPGHGNIDGTRFYDPQFWDPRQYRAWQDDYWQDLKPGTVTVGTPETLKQPEASPREPGKPGPSPSGAH